MPKAAVARTPSRVITRPSSRSSLSPFFRSIVQQELPAPHLGVSGKLPCFYYDNTTMTAIFTADSARVRALLPHPEMHLVEALPGRCMVAFTAFEYRDTDIDPYNEFSISFLIRFGRRAIPLLDAGLGLLQRTFETYVWQLPVTTELARWAGVELYGYPKFLGEIKFSRTKGELECALSENGSPILTLTGAALPTHEEKVMRYRTYSLKNNIPLCANIYLNPLAYGQSASPSTAALTLGDEHPIARTLQGLGLSAHPLLYQFAPKNELVLFGGRNLIDN